MRAVLTLVICLITAAAAGAAEQCRDANAGRICVTTFAAFTTTRTLDRAGRVTAVELVMPDVDAPGEAFIATVGGLMAALAPASSAEDRRNTLAGIMRGDVVRLGAYRWRASKAGKALTIEADYMSGG